MDSVPHLLQVDVYKWFLYCGGPLDVEWVIRVLGDHSKIEYGVYASGPLEVEWVMRVLGDQIIRAAASFMCSPGTAASSPSP